MFYEYEVTYWDDFYEKEVKEKGLTHARTYGEATEKVFKDYDHVIGIYISEWEYENTINVEEIKDGFELT